MHSHTEADLGFLQHHDGALPAVNHYHKAFHFGCYSSPKSASANLSRTWR